MRAVGANYMRKLYILVIAILYITNSKALANSTSIDKPLLERAWIAVESRSVGNRPISPIDGFILDFKDGKADITALGRGNVKTINYKLSNRNIITDEGRIIGKIKHLSLDSMDLLIDKDMQVLFLPLKESSKLQTSKDLVIPLLTKYPWYEKRGGQKSRFDFLIAENIAQNVSIRHYTNKGWTSKEMEQWSFLEYKGWFLIGITTFQTEGFHIYQVKNINESEIKTDLLLPDGYHAVEMNSAKLPSKNYLDKIKSIVVSKEWEMAGLEFYRRSEAIEEFDSVFSEENIISAGVSDKAEGMILQNDFLMKNLIFHFFPDNTYLIGNEREIVKKGVWEFTTDANFIMLDNPNDPNNYIEITNVDSNELDIRQTINLRESDKNHRFLTIDCKIKLK
jgi:hypothetical protein